MNLTMAITLDGLVRALRWKAHDLAESAESGYAGSRDIPSGEPSARIGIDGELAEGAGDELPSR
jgi:hypothetical protein